MTERFALTKRFRATIQATDRGGAYVLVPAGVVDALGGGGRIPVQATFDGAGYQGSIVRMGGSHVIGVRKDIRTKLGKAIGDSVVVTLARDTAKREVTVPADLRAALADRGLQAAFAKLSFTHQREYVAWIEDAKRSGRAPSASPRQWLDSSRSASTAHSDGNCGP